MKHRIISLLLPLILLFCVTAQAQSGSASAVFQRTLTYDGAFTDVSADVWYAPYAASVYEYGLMEGRGEGTFAPDGSITVAELLTLSARLHSTYENGGSPAAFEHSAESEDWFAPYFAYLKDSELLPFELSDYHVSATRAEMAAIFAVSLPQEWYDDRNAQLVTDAYLSRGFITDVDEYTPYQQEILWMYRQGILVGSDDTGSFLPANTVTRAEVAALLTRMVEPTLRLTPDWTVLSYHSAAGTALSDLVTAPESVNSAPAFDDSAAIDALVRQALAAEQNTVTLSYSRTLIADDASTIVHAFMPCVKTYCEQMYNAVSCRAYSTGRAELTFSSTACSDAELTAHRTETMARAISVHDELWETGALSSEMSEYEIAQTYFAWLCENCSYDNSATDNSLSHTAYGALCRGSAVCDGYTGAYNLFLKLEGIDCTALFNDTHIWTIATLDGTEYHIDVTWGDQYGFIDTSCFGMTAEQSRAKHAW